MQLTAANTAIVLDSTADFPDAPERFPNWRVVPLYVRFGDESFRDYVELAPAEFYARLGAAPVLPTTSQPTPGDFLAAYAELDGYERVFSLHISSKLSGTLQSAATAAADANGGRIRTVECDSAASAGIAMLALAIQRRLERGTTDEEVDELLERYAREAGLLFTVDTLEFLAKGGRIGRARAMAGHLLKVKPVLTIHEGEVVPVARVRGRQKALEEFGRRFEAATTDADGLRVGIAHADARDRVDELAALVTRIRPRAEIEVVTTLGAVLGTHAGPGTLGFFWFHDG